MNLNTATRGFRCHGLFMCVCVCYCLCLFVQRLRVNQWCSSAKNWRKLSIFNVRWCDIVFAWPCCWCACVCLTVCVCLYSVCASTSDVRAPKTEVNFRFSMFGGVILFLLDLVVDVCVCLTVCVCLYSVCASTTEVKNSSFVLWFELLCVQGFCVESCLCVKLCVCVKADAL